MFAKPMRPISQPVEGAATSSATANASQCSVIARVRIEAGTVSDATAVRAGMSCAFITPNSAKTTNMIQNQMPSPCTTLGMRRSRAVPPSQTAPAR